MFFTIPLNNYIYLQIVKNTYTNKMKKHVNLIISGKVQHVGFRFMAMQAAYKYGVFGYARNKNNGNIMIEAEGDEDNVNNFIEWCKIGPMGSTIKEIEMEEGEMQDYKAFDVKGSGHKH